MMTQNVHAGRNLLKKAAHTFNILGIYEVFIHYFNNNLLNTYVLGTRKSEMKQNKAVMIFAFVMLTV